MAGPDASRRSCSSSRGDHRPASRGSASRVTGASRAAWALLGPGESWFGERACVGARRPAHPRRRGDCQGNTRRYPSPARCYRRQASSPERPRRVERRAGSYWRESAGRRPLPLAAAGEALVSPRSGDLAHDGVPAKLGIDSPGQAIQPLAEPRVLRCVGSAQGPPTAPARNASRSSRRGSPAGALPCRQGRETETNMLLPSPSGWA